MTPQSTAIESRLASLNQNHGFAKTPLRDETDRIACVRINIKAATRIHRRPNKRINPDELSPVITWFLTSRMTNGSTETKPSSTARRRSEPIGDLSCIVPGTFLVLSSLLIASGTRSRLIYMQPLNFFRIVNEFPLLPTTSKPNRSYKRRAGFPAATLNEICS